MRKPVHKKGPETARPRCRRTAILLLSFAAAAGGATAQTGGNVSGTKHDLSRYGPGGARAVGETRICIFCHTPHNATALSPLWNKSLEPETYQVYASPTLKVAQKLGAVPQPSGPTKLCLSCHDGTIALGAVLNPSGGIEMRGSGTLPSRSLSNFGLDLRGHHPVSFRYSDSLPNPELASSPPPGLTYGGSDEIHCSTCHDPHDDRYGRFLAKDNRYSALCVTCHQIPGWSTSAHATSTANVSSVLPRPPNDWPTYKQLNEWGCESCHVPHFAATAEQLLIFTDSPPRFSCTSSRCHGSTPGAPHVVAGTMPGAKVPRAENGLADIGAQIQKASSHSSLAQASSPAGRSASVAAGPSVNSVACADCHNPHLVNNWTAQPPNLSGPLQGVRGVDRSGVEVRQASYEYEICFRCHADYSHDVPYVTRVVSGTNLRLAFDTNNPSVHPVVGPGWNPNVPSIPSSLYPTLRSSDVIACTSCHADDGGVSRGPHGSAYAPILRERYETADGTSESYDVYALCYRCHERTSILSDASFQKKMVGRTTPSGGGHSGHLSAQASCAACHDAHGVNVTGSAPSVSGDHTSLINFDIQTVQGAPGGRYPVFRKTGTYSGSCTLVCHGVTHNAWAYP
jgi:predicted CXXCH cytochrome family protein